MRNILNNSQKSRNLSNNEKLNNTYNDVNLRNPSSINNIIRSINYTHNINNNRPIYHHSSHNSKIFTINNSTSNRNFDNISGGRNYQLNDKNKKHLINKVDYNNKTQINKRYGNNLSPKEDNNYNYFINKRENTDTNINNNTFNNNTIKRRNYNYVKRIINDPKKETKEKKDIQYHDNDNDIHVNTINKNINNNNKSKKIILSKIPINNKSKPITIISRHNSNEYTQKRRHNTISTFDKSNNNNNKKIDLDDKKNEINENNKRYKEVLHNNENKNNKINYNLKKKKDIKDNKELTKEEILFDVTNKEIGIMNLGNTCFINSCLQVLIHCPLFIYNLAKNLKLINEDTPITSNFLSICDLMTKTEETSIDISDFKNLLGIKHEIFDGYLQNDSQEFCRILLEDISSELNEIKIKSIYRMLSNSNEKSKILREKDFHINFSEREKSIITELFYAQIVNTFICECKNEIYSFEKILDFPLLFPEKIKNNKIRIYELLKYHFKTEYIDFEINCSKCQKKSKHKKDIKISRPPEILILSLQRIDQKTQNKLNYIVEYPKFLSIYEFIDHECGFDKEFNYALFAIINHTGNINSGHYYSYIKIGNKDWFEFNDSEVKNIKTIPDCSEYVYALFYIKTKYNNSRFSFN